MLPSPSRSEEEDGLDELMVGANAAVGGEQQELDPDGLDLGVRPRCHVPDEADGIVVAGARAYARRLLGCAQHEEGDCQ